MNLKVNFKSEIKNIVYVLTLLSLPVLTGCKDDDDDNDQVTPSGTVTTNYAITNLVGDSAGLGSRVDASLKNAWGIAYGPTGNIWIAANQTSSTVIYDRNGNQQLTPVSIQKGNGAPTGVVANTTSDFVIPSQGQPALFIFAGEDGIISAWRSGDSAIVVANRSSAGAVYKGLTIANDGGANFIYAANFKGGSIDVFDNHFNYITTKPFTDPNIPAGFAPFNIENLAGQLYVTYAKQKGPDNEDDQSGAGNGYVNVFNTNGTIVKRFASQGNLNSPWGITMAPASFGQFSNAILIGNFGDGHISAYSSDGTSLGQLQNGGTPLVIDGLWALKFPENNIPAGDQNTLFFTAGPGDETHGVFGYIQAQ